MDNDGYDALCTAKLVYDGTEKAIAYNGIVDADAKFGDESDDALEKILFIHPDQEATLRKDADFMDKNKYPLDVVMNGTIGKIAGCQVVKSKKVKVVKYEKDNDAGTITIVKDETAESGTNKHLATIAANCIDKLAVGDKVKTVDTEFYACLIVVVDTEDPNEDPDADGVDAYAHLRGAFGHRQGVVLVVLAVGHQDDDPAVCLFRFARKRQQRL